MISKDSGFVAGHTTPIFIMVNNTTLLTLHSSIIVNNHSCAI